MGNKTDKVRVALAEDHPVVRNGISRLLNNVENIELVGEAVDGNEALRLVSDLKPDILLLDIEMPGKNGVEVTREIREKHPLVKILILSGYEDKQYIRELFQLGANGYLTKDEAPTAILEAVKAVAAGQNGWVSRRIASQMTTILEDDSKPNPDQLTQREAEVLALVVEGKTNQAISAELKISVKTVEKYMENIFRKMGVASRVEAAVQSVQGKARNKK